MAINSGAHSQLRRKIKISFNILKDVRSRPYTTAAIGTGQMYDITGIEKPKSKIGRQWLVLKQAEADLQRGRNFYDANQAGGGDYLFGSLRADIESLSLYAGHSGFKAQSILDSSTIIEQP